MTLYTIHANGKMITIEVPEGWELIPTDILRRLQNSALLLNDLDRSEVGRHKGDVENQDPSGVSQGNKFLTEGQRIGTTISGKPIYYPYFDKADLSDADLWLKGYE